MEYAFSKFQRKRKFIGLRRTGIECLNSFQFCKDYKPRYFMMFIEILILIESK